MALVDPTGLDDPKVDQLINLIKDSFRVRANVDPVYVDVGGHLARVVAAQHQIIFGRRGSGKSCLLVHFHRRARAEHQVLSVYIQADEVKRLPYPDLLIRLLISLFEGLRGTLPWWRRVLRRDEPIRSELRTLRELLELAERADITEEQKRSDKSSVGGRLGGTQASVEAGLAESESLTRTSTFSETKLESLERHLQDHKQSLRRALQISGYSRAAILVDDFYLISPALQPDVIDHLHRLVRDTNLYLKVGTVRHRTNLIRRAGQTVGVELKQDVEEVNLDQTLEDVDATKDYLASMLDSMGNTVGLSNVSSKCFNPNGLLELTLASGGVPRDYLTIFVAATEAARVAGKTKWLTATSIYKGAARVSYRTKLTNLREDVGSDASPLERVYQDLVEFCLREKRKTAFLLAQEDVGEYQREHELIQQLMDFKLIHVVEPDTSAASGRPGRYEAYTLDFGLFMEPRLRNIEHVKFWLTDEQRRKQGLREAPIYELSRARGVMDAKMGPAQTTENVIAGIEAEVGIDTEQSEDE